MFDSSVGAHLTGLLQRGAIHYRNNNIIDDCREVEENKMKFK